MPRSRGTSSSPSEPDPEGSADAPEGSADAPEVTVAVRLSDRVALVVATACGAGFAPIAPGTVASALTVVVLWFAQLSIVGSLTFLLVVTVTGIWAAHRAERMFGRKDPGTIVIDEVAGMTLSVALLPPTIGVLIAGFLLFRVFDIVKPFPAKVSQRLTGGFGVMVDDLIAGVYALVLLLALRAITGWP